MLSLELNLASDTIPTDGLWVLQVGNHKKKGVQARPCMPRARLERVSII